MVDHSWHEIADSLKRIEALAENERFPEKALAASVASKVYYYLEDFDESLRLALDAHERFDLNEKTQYVETLINQCIEKYIQLKQEQQDMKNRNVVIDDKMELVIEKMFETCFKDKKFKQAIGIALEARRLDKVK